MNNLSIFRRFSGLYKTKYLTYSTSSSKTTNLYFSMKKLIDSKQYQKALDLFQQQSELRTDISVNMALKACTKLHDYQSGINIEKQLSSHSLNNNFILTSLIHFYSKLLFFLN
jgi:AICAR transformylase/IMP cyclohydrolase PurH